MMKAKGVKVSQTRHPVSRVSQEQMERWCWLSRSAPTASVSPRPDSHLVIVPAGAKGNTGPERQSPLFFSHRNCRVLKALVW